MVRNALHHRRKVERAPDLATDFRQRRGFSRAPLRLVEEACVLQCDAHAVGQRLQQADVVRAERVLAPHVV